jgi:hypothetical protein
MGLRDCAECHRLSDIFWDLSTMVSSAEDELKITARRHKTYNSRKTSVLRLRLLAEDAYIKSISHRKEHQIVVTDLVTEIGWQKQP